MTLNPDDPLPAMKAEIDQMLMMAPELARTASTWFQAFKKEGFSDSQSLYLVAAQLTSNAGKAP